LVPFTLRDKPKLDYSLKILYKNLIQKTSRKTKPYTTTTTKNLIQNLMSMRLCQSRRSFYDITVMDPGPLNGHMRSLYPVVVDKAAAFFFAVFKKNPGRKVLFTIFFSNKKNVNMTGTLILRLGSKF